jgi:hypothetical protein
MSQKVNEKGLALKKMAGLFSLISTIQTDLTGLIAHPACLDFCVDMGVFAPGFAGDTSTGSAHRPSGLV